jgi:EAL domain-containing protein (putative c-di-GMP-specific phosphodiesterase class I)
VKIDGMFVRDIASDPIDQEMVRSITGIAKAMGKQTIAEFVENDSIIEILQEIDVDYIQCYGVARPQSLILLTLENLQQR